MFQFGGLGALFVGTKPTKASCGDMTDCMTQQLRPSQTMSKLSGKCSTFSNSYC